MIDLGALLIILALLVIVGGVIARPFLAHRSENTRLPAARYSELLAERDRVLDAIQELDFDHAMGKLESQEYRQQRAGLVQRGASILQTLDRWHESLNGSGRLPVAPASASENVEELVPEVAASDPVSDEGLSPGEGGSSRAVAGAARAATMSIDDDIEKLITARRQDRDGKSVGFCHRCGHVLQEQDRFCARCGAEHSKGT